MARETELYKDKIEVSLDGRQIFYLFFGGAVIVGLVFVLGVMVGRRVEARGHVERASVAATVDPLAALDRLGAGAGAGLMFQGNLRGEAAPTEVEKTIADMAAKQQQQKEKGPGPAKKEEAKREAAKREEVKKEEPRVEAKIEKPEPKKAEVKVEPKVDDKKVEAKADDKKPEKKTDAKVDDKKLEAKAEDKKPEKKTDAKVDDKKLEAKAEDKKPDKPKAKFTLQLSSFQDKTEAQSFLDSLKAGGFGAYITEGAVEGKTFYRVRLGSYRTMDAANDAKADFEKQSKKSAQVMKL